MAFFNEFPHTRNYDSDLGWLIRKVKYLLDCCETSTDKIDTLMEFMNDIESGDFPDSVVNAFTQWINKNLVDLVGELVKQVYFGLTDNGYFVAYVVESWEDIKFNTTNYDIVIPDFDVFGHLVLSY